MSDQDPQLAEAMTEVIAVLKRYDLGGFVILHNHDGAAFRMEFPSWSTARFRPKGTDSQVLHLKMEQADHQDVEGTVAMLMNFRDICVRAASQLDIIRKRMKSAGVEIDHNPVITERNRVLSIGPRDSPDSPPEPRGA